MRRSERTSLVLGVFFLEWERRNDRRRDCCKMQVLQQSFFRFKVVSNCI